MAKILIVEDNIDLCDQLELWLASEQHTVEVVNDGKEGSERLRHFSYDVIVLDWELPKLNGLEICKNFRAAGGTTPIIMLTGKEKVEEKEASLDSGADDYLTKPFNLKELSARIRALMRRPATMTGTILQVRDLSVDPNTRKVTRGGQEIQLLPKELALLEFFMRHPNEVFSVEALLNRVWSSESDSTIRTVYTNMTTLRKKIASADGLPIISTVHGLGYRLDR